MCTRWLNDQCTVALCFTSSVLYHVRALSRLNPACKGCQMHNTTDSQCSARLAAAWCDAQRSRHTKTRDEDDTFISTCSKCTYLGGFLGYVSHRLSIPGSDEQIGIACVLRCCCSTFSYLRSSLIGLALKLVIHTFSDLSSSIGGSIP